VRQRTVSAAEPVPRGVPERHRGRSGRPAYVRVAALERPSGLVCAIPPIQGLFIVSIARSNIDAWLRPNVPPVFVDAGHYVSAQLLRRVLRRPPCRVALDAERRAAPRAVRRVRRSSRSVHEPRRDGVILVVRACVWRHPAKRRQDGVQSVVEPDYHSDAVSDAEP